MRTPRNVVGNLVAMRNPASDLRRDFEGFLEDWFNPLRTGAPLQAEDFISPFCDFQDTDTQYLIDVEMPGVRKEDIKLEMRDNQLSIFAEQKYETKKEEGGLRYSERRYGKFQRTFSMPTPVSANGVEASYQDGILHISIPKSEEAKAKQIQVTGPKSPSDSTKLAKG